MPGPDSDFARLIEDTLLEFEARQERSAKARAEAALQREVEAWIEAEVELRLAEYAERIHDAERRVAERTREMKASNRESGRRLLVPDMPSPSEDRRRSATLLDATPVQLLSFPTLYPSASSAPPASTDPADESQHRLAESESSPPSSATG